EARREREDRPRGLDEAQRGDHEQVGGRVEHRPDDRPDRLPRRDVLGSNRRRKDRLVDLGVAQLPEDVRRVVPGTVHGRRREQRRCDERRVLDGLAFERDVAYELLQWVDEEEEIEERLEEAGEQDHPGPPVNHDVPLDDQQAPECGPRWSRQASTCDELAHQTTSLLRYVIRAASSPTVTHATRYARWRKSSGETSPSVRSRHSVTPCQSGVNQAITSSGVGKV